MNNNLLFTVKQKLERDAIVRNGLARGLISPRTLAAYIVKTEPELGANMETLRTVIRRILKDYKVEERNTNVNDVFKNSHIDVRSDIVKVEFEKGDATLDLINKSFKMMEICAGDLFRIIKGQKTLHLLVERENLEKVKSLFSGKMKDELYDLCELTMTMPEEAKQTPGIYSAIIAEISLNNINIVEGFSAGAEINVILSKQNAKKAFVLLSELLERAKE